MLLVRSFPTSKAETVRYPRFYSNDQADMRAKIFPVRCTPRHTRGSVMRGLAVEQKSRACRTEIVARVYIHADFQTYHEQ